jgi:hypothetical protein
MPENIHPGSFVGDSVEEFKKLPTWGKVLAAAGLGLAAYLGYRAYQSNAASAQSAAAGTAGISSTTAGTQSPFPMVGNLPLLPNNVNPVYDSSGNPIAYQQGPTPPPPTPAPNPPPVSGGPPGPDAGFVNRNPLIPSGQYKGPSYSNLKPGTSYTYNGTKYTLNAGPGGKLYGTNPQGHQVLLYGPSSLYKSGSDATHYGSMLGFMENPLVYLVSAKPHTPSTVPGH